MGNSKADWSARFLPNEPNLRLFFLWFLKNETHFDHVWRRWFGGFATTIARRRRVGTDSDRALGGFRGRRHGKHADFATIGSYVLWDVVVLWLFEGNGPRFGASRGIEGKGSG
jgi:hypothetical protein